MFGKSKAKDSTEPKAADTAKAKAPSKSKAPDTSASTAQSSDKLPSLREVQEQKKRERDAKIAEAKEKLREAVHQKKQHALERRQKLKAKRKRDLTIFIIGLLVMLTILIYAFPSPFMIVFSTLFLLGHCLPAHDHAALGSGGGVRDHHLALLHSGLHPLAAR